MKELIRPQAAFARAGGAGGGKKPAAPPPTTMPDLPPPPSPFDQRTHVPSAEGAVAPAKGTPAYWLNLGLLVGFGLLLAFAFLQMIRQIIRQRRENREK